MSDQLQEEKVTECKEIFDMFDKDKSGYISTKELADALRSLGLNPTSSELEDIQKEVDQDKTGKIEFKEFLDSFAKHMVETVNEEEFIDMFKIFDKKETGYIFANEFKHILTTIGDRLSKEEADEMLKIANPNADGLIDYRELIKILMSK